MNNNNLSNKEKEIVKEELQDVKDHVESLLECQAFENETQKEDMITKLSEIETIIYKLS